MLSLWRAGGLKKKRIVPGACWLPVMMSATIPTTIPNLIRSRLKECITEVEMTQAIMHKELGFYPTLLRPPAGLLTKEVEETFLAKGFDICLWSYSVKDWEGPNAAAVSKRILDQAFPGAIIACHDMVDWLIDTLDIIVPALRKEGYVFKKISESGQHGTIRKVQSEE